MPSGQPDSLLTTTLFVPGLIPDVSLDFLFYCYYFYFD